MSHALDTSPPPGGDEQLPGLKARLVGAWLFVGIPLTYGIVQTVRRAAALFTG